MSAVTGGGKLADYLSRPLAMPAPGVLEAIAAGPIEPADALSRDDLDRLLDPAPLRVEHGWCTFADGVGYVAIRTEMPGVSGEMVDWWFDWHPREPLRYRIWHPTAHVSNALEPAADPGPKAHWGSVHHPVEDVGTGLAHARIEFVAPRAIGFSTNGLGDPRVATIACGWAGDDRLRVRHSTMAHVFLCDGAGVFLRSRFWLGDALRPYGPRPIARAGAALLGKRLVRRLAMPAALPRALARHCAEEYANLASLLPQLYARYRN